MATGERKGASLLYFASVLMRSVKGEEAGGGGGGGGIGSS